MKQPAIYIREVDRQEYESILRSLEDMMKPSEIDVWLDGIKAEIARTIEIPRKPVTPLLNWDKK